MRSIEGWCQANGPCVPGGMTSSAHASSWLARKVLPRPILCRRRGVCVCAQKKKRNARCRVKESLVRRKGCARAVRGGLPPGFRCNCEGFLGFPEGFLRVSDRRLKRCQKNAVWVGLRRLCHAAKTKRSTRGIWSLYKSSPKIFQRRQWSSGRIDHCHRWDPGSIPG